MMKRRGVYMRAVGFVIALGAVFGTLGLAQAPSASACMSWTCHQ